MVFSSITFLFYFLPIVILIYYLVPNKIKNGVLLVFSLIFYFYGEQVYTLIMIFSIVSSYVFGILIDKYRKHSKILLIFFLIISIGMLVYFKYFNFIIDNINIFLKSKIDALYIILPIGISFYTFQMISYVVDVYKERAKVQKSIFKLALYISLFPQLVAGPIVRYKAIEEQLDIREHTIEKFSNGVRRFIIGLGKKVLIANVLGEIPNLLLVSNEPSVLFYWLYSISITLQIYFDFSGYSDMAIGLGKIFGFEFDENFDYPYTSTSITEFWRRWHMSLSYFFRDYIYIPLGGNRGGKKKWLRNIFIVWILTGLWHGASWNFIIWGLYFGILLVIEKLFLKERLEKMPKIFSRMYVMIIVMISFIIFNSENMTVAINNIKGLVGLNGERLISQESMYYLKSYFIVILLGIIGSTKLVKNIFNMDKARKQINFIEPIFLLVVFVLCTSYIVDGSFNPFLYFRF